MDLIILGHLLGDFYFQTDKICTRKKKSAFFMFLHCIFYMAGIYAVLIVLTGNPFQGLEIVLIIGLTHVLIDMLKVKADFKKIKHEYTIFILDQATHIILLAVICYAFKVPFAAGRYSLLKLTGNAGIYKVIMILTAGLICAKPSSILIALIFKDMPVTIESADPEETEKKGAQEEIVKIGSWIGILEREIILVLGLLGQYSAIGFVLAAKSLARYKQLENKAFAEKYLVGTLMSALIAIVCAAICSALI